MIIPLSKAFSFTYDSFCNITAIRGSNINSIFGIDFVGLDLSTYCPATLSVNTAGFILAKNISIAPSRSAQIARNNDQKKAYKNYALFIKEVINTHRITKIAINLFSPDQDFYVAIVFQNNERYLIRFNNYQLENKLIEVL